MLIQRPTNRRAGCEKIARPVRREGQGQIPCSYPYPTLNAKMIVKVARWLLAGNKIARMAVAAGKSN